MYKVAGNYIEGSTYPKWNFSNKVYDLMKLHGFHECAAEYHRSPGKFPPKEKLETIWRDFHNKRVSNGANRHVKS